MADADLRALCNLHHLREIPAGLDLALLRYHNKLHPPQAVLGEYDRQFWIERMVPDGSGGLLLVYVESTRLSWETEYRSTHYVYCLRADSLETVEEGLTLVEEAERRVPSEVRLLCTLSAGHGGGSKVPLDIASTRLGNVMHFDTPEGELPPAEFLLCHRDMVPDDVVSVTERELLAERMWQRALEAMQATGDMTPSIDIYALVGDLMGYRKTTGTTTAPADPSDSEERQMEEEYDKNEEARRIAEAPRWDLHTLEDYKGHDLPLHDACEDGAPAEITLRLIDAYPDALRTKDPLDLLPLHLACKAPAPAAVILALIEKHPEAVRVKVGSDEDGYSLPIHYACGACGQPAHKDAILKLVEEYPESLLMPDDQNALPIHYAQRSKRSKVLIRKLGELCPETLQIENPVADDFFDDD